MASDCDPAQIEELNGFSPELGYNGAVGPSIQETVVREIFFSPTRNDSGTPTYLSSKLGMGTGSTFSYPGLPLIGLESAQNNCGRELWSNFITGFLLRIMLFVVGVTTTRALPLSRLITLSNNRQGD